MSSMSCGSLLLIVSSILLSNQMVTSRFLNFDDRNSDTDELVLRRMSLDMIERSLGLYNPNQQKTLYLDNNGLEAFDALKIGHELRFITYKIVNDKYVVDQSCPHSCTYNDFLEALPPNEPRYGVYDFPYQIVDGNSHERIFFILWIPESASMQLKSLYFANRIAIQKELVGIETVVQATTMADITESTLRKII